MGERYPSSRKSVGRRILAATWLLFLASAVGTWAQAPSTSGVSVGTQLEAGGYFAMPVVSLLATAAFPVTGTHTEIVPSLGVTYLFFPMTGLSGSWYVPVGVELRFPDSRIGIVVQNLVAIDNTLGEGGVGAGLEAYLKPAKVGKSSFAFALQAGPTVFWNTASAPLFLISLTASFRYAYELKRAG